jgi:hypothetical protein
MRGVHAVPVGGGPGMEATHHSLVPVWAMPWMKYFCA